MDAQRYEIIAQADAMVPMRDGVRLATDVYLPGRSGAPAPGAFPSVVVRTPYGKGYASARAAAGHFTPYGYALVVQDVRGRYASEGRWRPLTDDGPDGADLLAWIAEQPWSDGKAGMIGVSYVGGTQHALALEGSPHLAAVVPVDAVSNPARFGMRHGGAFELRWVSWAATLGNPGINGVAPSGERSAPVLGRDDIPTGAWLLNTGQIVRPEDNPDLRDRIAAREAGAARANADPAAQAALKELGGHVRDLAKGLPLKPGSTALRFAPDYESWIVEALGHGEADAFWGALGVSVADHADRYQDIPALHVTGGYDSWAGSVASLNFPALSRAKRSPQRLLFGPWTHGQQAASFAGVAEFGPEAAVDMAAIQRRWFDRWLKGADNGAERDAPVRVFVMGGGDGRRTPEGRVRVGGRWRDEHEWPPARVRETVRHLHADGRLSLDPAGPSEPSRYRFDPRRPVPSLGGNVSSQGDLMMAGAQFQRQSRAVWPCDEDRALADRDDVLVFETAPLTEPVEIIGPIVVKLWASSDGPDTDFTAKLVDVYSPNADFPEGFALNVGDSIVRGRFRRSPAKAEMLDPGRPYEFTIELYPTALLFPPGHRIRLDISSSNFPRFDVNPNTGEPLNANVAWRVASNAIFHDPDHPSRLLLPVVPLGT